MNNLNLNMTLSIFLLGTALFLLAPVTPFKLFSINELFITGMMIQMLGVIASLFVFYRTKVTEKILKEI